MSTFSIPPPKAVELNDASSAATNWKKLLKQWTYFELATGLETKKKDIRLATFLSIIGDEGLEKYESFTFESEEDRNDIKIVIQKFEQCCNIVTNVLHERYKFLQHKQQDESIEQFVTRLKILSSTCEYQQPMEMVRD